MAEGLPSGERTVDFLGKDTIFIPTITLNNMTLESAIPSETILAYTETDFIIYIVAFILMKIPIIQI